jgi:hypothetical protein
MYVDGVAPHHHVVENGSVGNICYRGFQSTPYMIQFLYLHIPSSNKRLSIIEYQQYDLQGFFCQWLYSKEKSCSNARQEIKRTCSIHDELNEILKFRIGKLDRCEDFTTMSDD